MSDSFHRVTFTISLTYIVIVSAFLIWFGAGFSSNQILTILAIIILVSTRFRQFIFSVPSALFFGYQYLGGLIPKLTKLAHVHIMPYFDKTMFGYLPTTKLQSLLFSSTQIHWYDYMAVGLYMVYGIVPISVCVLFWYKDRKVFKEFCISLLLLTYLAYITYIVFPAMPPWMASQQGFIPNVVRIMDKVVDTKIAYNLFGANLVAAVPSLHAAYPLLAFLFLFKKFKSKALLFLPYVVGVWFSVVYLGEHYVFDVLIGIAYTSFIFILVTKYNLVWSKISKIINTRSKLIIKGVSKSE